MGRLIIISNRLPVNVVRSGKSLSFSSSVGGLATGLASFYKSCNSIWIGWPGITPEKSEEKSIAKKLASEKCYPVFISQHDVDNYYNGFCNKTIWPLFHYFTQFTTYNESWWNTYIKINELFCEAVMKEVKPDDMIWIHDYQLMLLPKMIREKLPDANIGFFLHIPFPSFEIFRTLPWRKEIIEGLLGADLLGFHTYGYARNFTETASRMMGYEHKLDQIVTKGRIVNIDVFPMGIDYNHFSSHSNTPTVKRKVALMKKKFDGKKLILSIDRLDYTKGVIQRLKAFDLFLEKNPQHLNKVSMILVAVPSRAKMDQYASLKREVDELVGKINGKYADFNWTPITYIYRTLSFDDLISLYKIADVSIVTPLRDGMNLMAKEFLATKTDGKGVLILSEMTGSSKEMGESIIVNPHDTTEVANAIQTALTMDEAEQIKRNTLMQARLMNNDVTNWAKSFTEDLESSKEFQKILKARNFDTPMKTKMKNAYTKAEKRLILLDYDGTLVDFKDDPLKASPDKELISIISKLSEDPHNKVAIVSGRDRKTLSTWFNGIDITIIAEHGTWIKERGKSWKLADRVSGAWKRKIRKILDVYVERTPGSFVEEKDFSLVWHYRNVDSDISSERATELKGNLVSIVSNIGLNVLDGNKIVEIRSSAINKGKAVLGIIEGNEDMIIAIGDDRTDEDMFAVLPKNSYSFKVGSGISLSRFNLRDVASVRNLLSEISETTAVQRLKVGGRNK